MDPNVTYALVSTDMMALRAMTDDSQPGGEADSRDVALTAMELLKHLTELNTWLRRGSFLPDAWADAGHRDVLVQCNRHGVVATHLRPIRIEAPSDGEPAHDGLLATCALCH